MIDTNLIKILENTLLEVPEYLSEDGKILKAKVYEDAMEINPNLIKLLLKNESLGKVLFSNIDDVVVFDKQKLLWLLEHKEFLPDSYTRFRNKIGLTDGKGNFISTVNDVVLSFPYKDCVLVGGQDKEDQKKDEIFFNEFIGSEQITRMFSPKVFTNAKRYSKEGMEENVEFTKDDNLIIKGNNLIALSSLLERYEGEVKCVYIDPPYNPDSVANTFSYNNRFNHSTWITFMKNRAEQAKKILNKEGFFCCSIDHNELFYAGVLFDEIFGRENRVGIVSVETNPGGRSDSTFLATSSEYFIIYAKNIEHAIINDITKDEKN
ncbi:MAG: site-specific DNA-methyltransferase [Peptoniphilaceae bacterium]